MPSWVLSTCFSACQGRICTLAPTSITGRRIDTRMTAPPILVYGGSHSPARFVVNLPNFPRRKGNHWSEFTKTRQNLPNFVKNSKTRLNFQKIIEKLSKIDKNSRKLSKISETRQILPKFRITLHAVSVFHFSLLEKNCRCNAVQKIFCSTPER